MSKNCIACGMPMEQKEDFAQQDTGKDYCVHCARPDGRMQSYQEKLDSLTGFIVKTQGFEPSQAREMARGMMAKLPAWRGMQG